MNQTLLRFFQEVSARPNVHRSYTELAELLGVSTRTIRNYYVALEDYAKDVGLTSVLRQWEKGLIYSGGEAQTGLLLRRFYARSYSDYHFSKKERMFAIQIRLLALDDAVTITQMMQFMDVSRSTIISDMEQVRSLLEQQGVSFSDNLAKGYVLIISEAKRRELLLQLCAPYVNHSFSHWNRSGVFAQLINQTLVLDELLPSMEALLRELETGLQLEVPDRAFHQLAFYCALVLRRLQSGKTLPEGERKPSLSPDLIGFARRLSVRMGTIVQVPLSEAEVNILAQQLEILHLGPQSVNHKKNLSFFVQLYDFAQQVEETCPCGLLLDSSLLPMFYRHMLSIRSGKPPAENPILSQDLQQRYPSICQAVFDRREQLFSCFGRELSFDELSMVQLYFAAAYHRQHHLTVTPRAVVVCHIGIGTGHFLADCLREIFNINIVGVSGLHKLPELVKRGNLDLIISTLPLTVEGYPTVHVSANLTDSDILAVQKVLRSIRVEAPPAPLEEALFSEEKPESLNGFDFLSKDSVLLDVDCQDWRCALLTATAPLVQKGSVSETYGQAIIRSVEQNGPYFVFLPGVALGHSAPADGVNMPCCSFLRLKTPVPFHHKENDPVRFVLIVGITDVSTQISLISRLMQKLSSDELRRFLETATSEEIIYHLNERILTDE